MLRWRLSLGMLFASMLVAVLLVDSLLEPPGLLLLPVTVFVAVLASQELLSMLAHRQLNASPTIVYVGNVILVVSAAPWLWGGEVQDHGSWTMAALVGAFICALLEEMRRYDEPGRALTRAAAAAFSLCYLGLPLAYLVSLRLVGGGRYGTAAILTLLIIVKLSDVGAYTVGRLFGRHSMAPALSPGKTVEGALGAFVFGVLGAGGCVYWLIPLFNHDETFSVSVPPPWRWITFGLLVTLAGMLGDLAESLIKRDTGVKDSSSWMPGFGGVLDLLDSVLLAAPVAYWCWTSGLLGF